MTKKNKKCDQVKTIFHIYFFSKLKIQVSSLSTQEIPLVDFSNRLIASQDENTGISSATKKFLSLLKHQIYQISIMS